MAYCTQSDLEKQLPPAQVIQLADDNGDGVADTGVVAEAIAKADDEINAYCATRYTVPFSPVPSLIKTLSVDLTVWNLYDRKVGAPEKIKRRYDRAVVILKGISNGSVTLGTSEPPPETELGGAEATIEVDENRTFTKDTLKNF